MSDPDVMKQLDYWLDVTRRTTGNERTADVVLMERARNEVEHYRALYIQGVRLLEDAEALMGKVRAEALEEAAQRVQALMKDASDVGSCLDTLTWAANEIRALKDKRHE